MDERGSDIKRLARAAVECGFLLHDELGPGLLESAYEAFLAVLLRGRGLKVETQRMAPVTHRGVTIRDAFRIDLMVENRLIIEVKSVERLTPIHAKQLLTYFRLADRPLGLLMNFGADLFRQRVERVINNRSDYVAPSRPVMKMHSQAAPRSPFVLWCFG